MLSNCVPSAFNIIKEREPNKSTVILQKIKPKLH